MTLLSNRPNAMPVRPRASYMTSEVLVLAAAPTFVTMALLTVLSGGPDMPCMAAQDALPFSGMVPMYFLMALFHLTPWLKLAHGVLGRAAERKI